jgi:phage tail-like protein
MPVTAAVVDPFRAYNWRLEIGGGAQAYFTACSGLGITVDVIKYREAGNLQIVRSIPGQVNYEPITFYYGLTPSREIFDWLMAGVQGRADRRNASIIVLNSEGNEDATAPRWNLENAWVAAWRGAQLNAMSLEVAIESITLVFDRMTRA